MPELMEQGLEERLKTFEKELAGVGKENLENIKEAFENPRQENDVEREQIVIERSAADMKRIKNAFIEVIKSPIFSSYCIVDVVTDNSKPFNDFQTQSAFGISILKCILITIFQYSFSIN